MHYVIHVIFWVAEIISKFAQFLDKKRMEKHLRHMRKHEEQF